MFSILSRRRIVRSGLGACLAVSAISAAGCRWQTTQPPAEVSAQPLVEDEAIARRDWEPIAANYPMGATVAFPVRYPLKPELDIPEWQHFFVDPAMFLANTAILPGMLIIEPPGSEAVYHGEIVPVTYTAVPPLPAPLADSEPLEPAPITTAMEGTPPTTDKATPAATPSTPSATSGPTTQTEMTPSAVEDVSHQ